MHVAHATSCCVRERREKRGEGRGGESRKGERRGNGRREEKREEEGEGRRWEGEEVVIADDKKVNY